MITEYFTENVKCVKNSVGWEKRTAEITGADGEIIFKQEGIECPKSWSQLALNVVASKYFYGEVGTERREWSVWHLIDRVCSTIALWGHEDGYFTEEEAETFYRELSWLCLNQYGAFNSPVWFNVGLYEEYGVTGDPCGYRVDTVEGDVYKPKNSYEYPQCSACFIQSVEDTMESIMELAVSEAMLFKFGSGTGTDLSTIRSRREKLAGGGTPSGPLSFMRIYDSIAGVVKSGGKTRRAAKMQTLNVSHPDIMEFIECKWKEEQKAHKLIESGYPADFNGEAYSSIAFQNANLSVRIDDSFWWGYDSGVDYYTKWVTDSSKNGPIYKPKELLRKMAECAWHCGDPGIQYAGTINKWNTVPNFGPINSSNPCVTGDTKVATVGGWRRIDEMVGKQVAIINGQGDMSVTNSIFPTGLKQTYELETKSGYRLQLTEDHKVWTENRGYVEAALLTEHDTVKLIGSGFGDSGLSISEAELLGCTIGDGCVVSTRHSPQLIVTLGKHDHELMRCLEDVVGKSSITTPTTLRLTTVLFVDLFSKYAVLDKGSSRKDLTDSFFSLNQDSQAAVLRGIFTTDGTVSKPTEKTAYVSLDSTSLSLLQNVQLVLLNFGIKSKIYKNRRGGNLRSKLPDGKGGMKWYDVKEAHSLRISKRSRLLFERWIGFMPQCDKWARLRELNYKIGTYSEPLTDKVKSVEYKELAEVYDLTEYDDHSFIANGIKIHNCSEFMHPDDTSCNLASLNLMKFRKNDGTFNCEAFEKACRVFITAQEILVSRSTYPTEKIARNSEDLRPLGLGYSNLGALLMSMGLPYDSNEGRKVCSFITALMHGVANETSVGLALKKGAFKHYEANKEEMLNVMNDHVSQLLSRGGTKTKYDYIYEYANKIWVDVIAGGAKYGFRNSQVTVLAPTGTISFMMDCDTTGIEPDISLVKYKQLAGGGQLKYVNQTVGLALKYLKYPDHCTYFIDNYIENQGSIEGAPDLKPEHLPIFDCAFKPQNGERSIPWQAHLKMMAAAQPFLSGAISKTVNMPADSTVDDIVEAYKMGHELGLKAVAVYRDGCKLSQPLSTSAKEEPKKIVMPKRQKMPITRKSITHKFEIGGHEGYLVVGLYENGDPGELFIVMSKEGSTIRGLMDCFGTAVSLCFQYGVPLQALVDKFSHVRFEPMGFTKNDTVKNATSIPDYIFRWMDAEFGDTELEVVSLPSGDCDWDLSGLTANVVDNVSDTPICDNCGGLTQRSGSCHTCTQCGTSMGCS